MLHCSAAPGSALPVRCTTKAACSASASGRRRSLEAGREALEKLPDLPEWPTRPRRGGGDDREVRRAAMAGSASATTQWCVLVGEMILAGLHASEAVCRQVVAGSR